MDREVTFCKVINTVFKPIKRTDIKDKKYWIKQSKTYD